MAAGHKIQRIPVLICRGLIRFYQICLSPLFPPVCRFQPSCSSYALDALRLHGFFKGLYLTVRRLLRCHPFHPGGWDPVPPKKRPAGEVKRQPPEVEGIFDFRNHQ